MKNYHKALALPWRAPRFVTLTLPSSDDPSRDDKKLKKAFQKLRQELPHVFEMGIWNVETGDGADGLFNVHMHITTEGVYISQKALSRRWFNLTGAPIVWIEKVGGKNDKKTLEDSIAECTKYVTKGLGSLSDDVREKLYLALFGRRTFGSWGWPKKYSSLDTRETIICPVCGKPMKYECSLGKQDLETWKKNGIFFFDEVRFKNGPEPGQAGHTGHARDAGRAGRVCPT